MKKESSIAIFLGIILGLIFAVILIQSTKDKQKPIKKIVEKPSIKAPVKSKNIIEFNIVSPNENFISNKENINIEGTAPEKSMLILISPKSEIAIKTTTTSFNQELKLQEGINNINLYLLSNGDITSRSLNIYYIPE